MVYKLEALSLDLQPSYKSSVLVLWKLQILEDPRAWLVSQASWIGELQGQREAPSQKLKWRLIEQDTSH